MTEQEEKHPLKVILSWYDTLSPSMKTDVAGLVLTHMPDFSMPADSKEYSAALCDWLSVEKNKGLKITGKSIIFRGLLNYTCGNRFYEEGWKETQQNNQYLVEKLKEDGHEEFSEKVLNQKEQMLLRSKHWIKAGATWLKLCDTVLSDDELKQFSNSLMSSVGLICQNYT